MPQNIDFKEFIAVPQKTWEDKIREEIKLASEKNLYWEPVKGIKIAPFYSSYNFEYNSTRSGNFSSNTLLWKIREKFDFLKDKKTDKFFKKINQGVEAFEVSPTDFKPGEWLESINLLPAHVSLHFIEKNQEINKETISLLDQLLQSKKFKGSILYEPWTPDSENFLLQANHPPFLPLLKNHADRDLNLLYIRCADLNSKELSVVGQLAVALAKVVECVDVLTEQEIPVIKSLQIMEIEFLVGQSYFLEIAKLRAWCLLWTSLMASYGIKGNYFPPIHCVPSIGVVQDKNLNIVKYTAQAMSAVIGGCDYLTILPLDPENKDKEFSSRISRNISLLLKEEANMTRQGDPAAGSFYIENITNMVFQKAWELFLEIEKQGGLSKVVKNKSVNIE